MPPLAQSSPRAPSSSTLQVIPLGIIHVTLAGVDAAPLTDVSARQAVEIRTRADASYRATYTEPGHRRWFFHAFDAAHLVFVVARYEPKPVRGGTYIAEQRYRVARSAGADVELGVADIVRQYEVGEQGVRAGMSPAEVEAVLGAQHETRELGPIGSFDYLYSTVCVRFLSFKAADIMPRASCRP